MLLVQLIFVACLYLTKQLSQFFLGFYVWCFRNLLKGDTLSGSWATVGVLTEKGSPKTSSTGKSYCIWKIGCLDEQSITIFLFGDAYKKHYKEPASTVFAFFNAGVRKDAMVRSCLGRRSCFCDHQMYSYIVISPHCVCRVLVFN